MIEPENTTGGPSLEDEDIERQIGSMVLSSELNEALSDALPSSDPLDNAVFNPVEYINKLFPNGIKHLCLISSWIHIFSL